MGQVLNEYNKYSKDPEHYCSQLQNSVSGDKTLPLDIRAAIAGVDVYIQEDDVPWVLQADKPFHIVGKGTQILLGIRLTSGGDSSVDVFDESKQIDQIRLSGSKLVPIFKGSLLPMVVMATWSLYVVSSRDVEVVPVYATTSIRLMTYLHSFSWKTHDDSLLLTKGCLLHSSRIPVKNDYLVKATPLPVLGEG